MCFLKRQAIEVAILNDGAGMRTIESRISSIGALIKDFISSYSLNFSILGSWIKVATPI